MTLLPVGARVEAKNGRNGVIVAHAGDGYRVKWDCAVNEAVRDQIIYQREHPIAAQAKRLGWSVAAGVVWVAILLALGFILVLASFCVPRG